MAKQTFEWRVAFSAANEIRSKLEPYCQQIMIVGSLRRRCETVHDIDIVLCGKRLGDLSLLDLDIRFNPADFVRRELGKPWCHIKGKSKLVSGTYAGIPVDLYFATPDTWWTLVVIRTGSAGHNIRLCSRAMAMGMKLHADGTGLVADFAEDPHSRYAPKSEEDLFEQLQIDYVEPKDRR